jgi:hypothetical protein
MSEALAPIALFVFNRPTHTRRTLEALAGNDFASDSDLVVFSDGPRNSLDEHLVAEVRELVQGFGGFRSVKVEAAKSNKGLARSVIEGVTMMFDQSEQLIVLEDDLVTSRNFLGFMNEALEYYRDDSRVASIHGFCPPMKIRTPDTFFLRGADCWGWGAWRRSWDGFRSDSNELLLEIRTRGLQREFDLYGLYPFTDLLEKQAKGEVDSWAIRWHASMFLANKFTLYPSTSLVQNIGMDGSGTHFRDSVRELPLDVGRPILLEGVDLWQDESIARAFAKGIATYTGTRSWTRRIRAFAKRVWSHFSSPKTRTLY